MDSLHEIKKQREEIKNQPIEIKAEELKDKHAGEPGGNIIQQAPANQPVLDERIKAEKEENLGRILLDDFTNEQIEKNEAIKTASSPDLEKMRKSHNVVMEYRLKKKNIIKPNEYELVPKVDNKEVKLQDKMRNKVRITRDVDTYTDRMIYSRKKVPMELKKHFDYHTFSSLNDITNCMQEKEGQQAMRLMGGYKHALKEEEKKEKQNQPKDEEKIRNAKELMLYPAMDMLSAHIMKIDYLALDMSDDDMLAKNCYKLEEMSKAVQGFTKMLRDNPDYLDRLLTKKVRGTNESMGERLMKRLDILTAMSDYYRIRRVLIEDETYISLANEEISYEDKEGDTVQLKRVKKLMRSSFFLAQNLSNELKGSYKLPIGFEGHLKEASLVRNKINYDSNNTEEKNKEIKRRLTYFRDQTKAMNELENFRYSIAPTWMQNALSIDPDKQVSAPKAKGEIFSSGHTTTEKVLMNDIIKQNGREKFIKEFINIPKIKKKNPNTFWSGSPVFKGGQDKNLEKIDISDDYDRTLLAMALEYGYRRTNAEMMEMFDYLSIQMDAEMWGRVKDEDEKAFYESAFKEMSMKQISIVYSTAARLAESAGMEASILHPIDLLMQVDSRLRACLFNNSLITNVDTVSNSVLVKELFDKENEDDRFDFDIDKFHAYSGMVCNLNFTMACLIGEFVNIVMHIEEEEDELCEALFGRADFMEKVIQMEYNKAFEDVNHPAHDSAVKFAKQNSPSAIILWYFDIHPEYLTPEYLCKKIDGDKKGVIKKCLKSAYETRTNDNAEEVAYCIEHGLVNKYSRDKLEKYNESLKKRDFPIIRYQKENDDPNKDVQIKINGEVKGTKKMSEIIENRNADPYGVFSMGEGFKELQYKDEQGQVHFLDNTYL